MSSTLKLEKQASDLPRFQRILLLILVSAGSSIIYTPAYLSQTFYGPMLDALHLTNTQLGSLVSTYAIAATICYLPSGVLANRIRVRTLSWTGFVGTAVLVYVYALLPSYTTLLVVFVGMGVTTILVWWGIRFKLVRLISTPDGYSRSIGISYGIYGAAGLIIGLISTWIVLSFASNSATGVSAMLIMLATVILALGILSFLFIPRFESEIGASNEKFNLRDVGTSLKSPVIWLSAVCLFFVYLYYTGVSYTTPYLQNVLGASLGVVSIVSVIRTYGITLFSAPLFGVIAGKVKSASVVIAGGSILAVVSLVGFAVLPSTSATIVVAAAVIILLGFIAGGVYGIVSSQLAEGKVPLPIFGTATGLLSVVGFLPDTFSTTWFGALIDDSGDAAYPLIFAILAGSAALAAVFAIALWMYVKKNKQRLDAEYERAMLEAAEATERTAEASASIPASRA